MNRRALAILVALLWIAKAAADEPKGPTVAGSLEIETHIEAKPSGACDFDAFMKAAVEAQKLRSTHLASVEEFAKLAAEPGTIILDARSPDAYAALRVKGSINLPYTDFSQESLRQKIPDKETRILIYCRNNITTIGRDPLTGEPLPLAALQFRKRVSEGLNVPTYIALYDYGYRNVWELDPVVDPNHSSIEFVGTAKQTSQHGSAATKAP